MTIEKLIRSCLAYIEQDSDIDVMSASWDEIVNSDTFTEYIYNIEPSIYMGLVRFAHSKILPIKEYEITFDSTNKISNSTANIEDTNGNRLFYEIKEVYGVNQDNNSIINNVPCMFIGNKVRLRELRTNTKYYVIYYPIINDLDTYKNSTILDIKDIELKDLGVPDDMAINIKYLVYSDMKMEEAPSVANINKNYFESYIAGASNKQDVQTNQVNIINREWGDIYGD